MTQVFPMVPQKPVAIAPKAPPSPVLWLLYFLMILWAALPHGMDTELVPFTTCDYGEAPKPPCLPDPLKPLATNAEIIRLYYTADAAFIAKKAKAIVEAHDWAHLSLWPLWPPGMVVLEAGLYWLSPALPVALILVLITCALWAAVLAVAAGLLRAAKVPWAAASLLPLLLLLTQEFGNFLHSGLFYTESYSIGFFLLGVGTLVSAVSRRSFTKAALSGLLLALSAYMRAQTDMVMAMMLGLFLCCLLTGALHLHQGPRAVLRASCGLALLAVALLSYHTLTLPYRVMHGMQWIGVSQNPIWHSVWQKPDEMPPVLQFMVDGGVLAGCAVDPDLCAQIHARRAAKGEGVYSIEDYQRFTVQTALSHPVKWLAFKLPYLCDFWFRDMPESAVLTLLLVLMLLFYSLRGGTEQRLLALLLVAAAAGIIGPLLLAHVEPRYLYQLRLLILYAALAGIKPAQEVK